MQSRPLIANRVTEKEIRDEISGLGFDGSGARITDLELVAIEPPGWKQVFRFSVRTFETDLGCAEHFGCVTDDERWSTTIELFLDEAERDKRISEIASDFRAQNNRQTGHAAIAASCVVMTLILVLASRAILNEVAKGWF